MICLRVRERCEGEGSRGVLLVISHPETDAIEVIIFSVTIAIMTFEFVVRRTIVIVLRTTDINLAAVGAKGAKARVVTGAEVEAGAIPVTDLRSPSHRARTGVRVVAGVALIRKILDLGRLPVLARDHILVLVLRHQSLQRGIRTKRKGKKIDASVDQQKRKEDDENKDKDKPSKTEESELKKGGDDGAGSPSSAKGADKSNKEVVKRSQSRSRSTSRDSHGRSRRGRRELKRKDTRNNNRSSDSRSSLSLSRSHSPTSVGSRSHSPASSSYSTSSFHNSRGRRQERKSKRRRR